MYELLIIAAFGGLGIASTRLRGEEINDISRKVGT
jgi:hypothetical protein